jgi:hypothetical protein
MIEIEYKGIVKLSENTEVKDPVVSYVGSHDTAERIVSVTVRFHSDSYSHVKNIGTFEYEQGYQWTDDDLEIFINKYLEENSLK